jgi:hypothetical protein
MKKKKAKAVPIGRLIPELVIWSFHDDEEIVRHYADQLAKAIQLSYNLSNFGVKSFGMSEEE